MWRGGFLYPHTVYVCGTDRFLFSLAVHPAPGHVITSEIYMGVTVGQGQAAMPGRRRRQLLRMSARPGTAPMAGKSVGVAG